MRSLFYLFIILIINTISAIPGAQNYVAPSNSTRVLRQAKNLEDALAERQDDSEDVGPLGEVQLDVEEEDIGEAAQPKMRVRRGYNSGGQQRNRNGGGQSNSKYGGNRGDNNNKYGGRQQQQKQQPQSQYGQQSSGGRYGGAQQSQGGSSGRY